MKNTIFLFSAVFFGTIIISLTNPLNRAISRMIISDTNQTLCYDQSSIIDCPGPDDAFYGQDASYIINPPLFTKLNALGDSLPISSSQWTMVRDENTGFIWETKTDDQSIHDHHNIYSWYSSNVTSSSNFPGYTNYNTNTEFFIESLNQSAYAGYSDWRLPSIKELRTIIDYSNPVNASFHHYFPYGNDVFYWTSESDLDGSFSAWGIYFSNGYYGTRYKSKSHHIRAVRGTEMNTSGRFFMNNDETVVDTQTGLMFSTITSHDQMNWENALIYSEQLTHAGFTDWRLPNIQELTSILNFSKSDIAIDSQFFSGLRPDAYWASTTVSNSPNLAWAVHFDAGYIYRYRKSDLYWIQVVRGGQSLSDDRPIIRSPEQADHLKIGEILPIKWNFHNTTETVHISLSRYGGRAGTFETIHSMTKNDGFFEWTITKPASPNCVLNISIQNSESTQCFFSIVDDSPPIITPIQNQCTEPGNKIQVIMNITDTDGGPIMIRADSTNTSLIPNKNITLMDTLLNTATIFSENKQITMSILPEALLSGTSTIIITACDSGFLSNVYQFDITVEKEYYPFNVHIVPAGKGHVSGDYINCPTICNTFFEQNTPIHLEANEISGYNFLHWLGNSPDTIIETDTTLELSTNGATSLTAVFKRNHPPKAPEIVFPNHQEIVSTDTVRFHSGPYQDPEMDTHLYTWWMIRQITRPYQCDGMDTHFCQIVASDDLTVFETGNFDEGMKYAWKVGYSDVIDEIPVFSKERTFIIGNSLTDETCSITPGVEFENYQMISFIQWPENASSMSVFGDELGGNYDMNQHRIGTYNAGLSRYIECNENFEIAPGRAYWILSRKPMNIRIEGVKVTTLLPVEIKLHYSQVTKDGWNMIGCPNNAIYEWKKLKVVRYNDKGHMVDANGIEILESEIKTIDMLGTDNKMISTDILFWNNGQYKQLIQTDIPPEKQVLHPYKGYWVEALQDNVYLRFDPSARTKKKTIKRSAYDNAQPENVQEKLPPAPMTGKIDEDENTDNCFISICHGYLFKCIGKTKN